MLQMQFAQIMILENVFGSHIAMLSIITIDNLGRLCLNERVLSLFDSNMSGDMA